jgi:flagellar hook protein FlgE
MSLTSTLYTGLTGLNVNQTQLNVVGNNIANSNTVGFKASRTLFSSQFYVTQSAGTAPGANQGGSNPDQLGLGAQVAAVQQDFTDGSIESTGVDTDMAIDGGGFFIVNSPDGQRYTRDGSFSLNSSNQLVNTAGDFVQGFAADASGNIITGNLQNITVPLASTTDAAATTSVTLQGNLNAAGAAATGQSILNSQLLTTVGGAAAPTDTTLLTNIASESAPGTALFTVGDTLSLAGQKGGRTLSTQTFTVTGTTTVADLENFLNGGMGIDTTVGGTPAPGTDLQASTTNPDAATLTMIGNTGTENGLEIPGSGLVNQNGTSPLTFLDGTDAAGDKSNANGESVHTSFVAYDSLGNPITVDVTAVLQAKSSAGNTWQFYATSADNQGGAGTVLGDGTLTFDSTGALVNVTGNTISIDRAGTGAQTPMTITMNFGSVTQLAGTTSDLVMSQQNGSPIGTLSSFSVGTDGTITGSYTNGTTKTLGQVAVATFANDQGLSDDGGNLYQSSPDSGVAVVSGANALGAGAIRAGSLELSNVDLSKEFTNLIIASTGYAAASKVISTSDQLLTDLLNTTR